MFVFRTHDGTIGIRFLDYTVVVLHDEVFTQFLPSINGTLSCHLGIVGQEFLGLCRVLLVHGNGYLLDTFLRIGKRIFQLVLYGTHVVNHQAITRTNHIGHPVVNPESRVPRESHTIGSLARIALRQTVCTAIYRCKRHHVGIVCTEPKHTTYGIRQLGTHLCHESKCRLLGRDRTFVEILLAIHLECQRRKTIRHLETGSTYIVGDVEGSTFVVVTHSVLDVAYRHRLRRLCIKRHRFLALTLYIWQVLLAHTFAEHVIETPYTGFASTQATEVERTICIGKAEVLVQAIEVSLFLGKGNDIRGIKAVFLVVQRELMDT